MAFAHAWRRMTVYAVVWDDGVRHWRCTLRPHVDAAYWRRQGAHAMVPLEPPAPAMWAEYACRLLQRLEEQRRAREDGPAAPRPERPWRGRVAGSGESFLHRLSRWLFGWTRGIRWWPASISRCGWRGMSRGCRPGTPLFCGTPFPMRTAPAPWPAGR